MLIGQTCAEVGVRVFKSSRLILSALVALSTLLASQAPAAAAPSGSSTPAPAPSKAAGASAAPSAGSADVSWGVEPSTKEGPNGRDNLSYELKPGESVTDYVGVSNFGSEPLKMHVYAMDALMTEDGAFTLPPAGVEPTDVGSWVGLTGDGTYTINPGERLDIPFRLAVPSTASPGDHAGGIVASLSEPVKSTTGGAQQVAVDRRVGVRIYLQVAGDRAPRLEVGDVQVGYQGGWNPVSGATEISYTVRNTGNVRLSGTAAVDLSGVAGWSLGHTTGRQVPEILPGSAIRMHETFDGVFPAFKLNAAVTVDPVSVGDAGDDVGAPALASGSTWAWPYLILAALLVVFLVILLLWWRGRRWRKRAKAMVTAASAAATPVGAGAGPTAADR